MTTGSTTSRPSPGSGISATPATTRSARFARSLTLDWIDRDGRFDRDIWGLSLTARRVLNWLRHFNILVEGANPEDAR